MKPQIYNALSEEKPLPFSEIQKKILAAKKERGAVILAHNYVCREIQEIADYVGDSLGLAREVKKTDAKVIAFAGVDFMAETAKILNPEKTVVLPDRAAGCSLEELCNPLELAELKKKHPDAIVISYINCSAKVKALSDIICTSGNAVDIVGKIPKEQKIIFCPDKHLGSWICEKLNREMILWDGYCKAHVQYDADELAELKKEFPLFPLICHPECPKSVRDIADCVCSTEKMINFCRENSARTFIIATVAEMIHRLRREVPDKSFMAAPASSKPCQKCDFMDLNTPEKLLACIENLSPEIKLDAETADAARNAIEKMLELSN